MPGDPLLSSWIYLSGGLGNTDGSLSLGGDLAFSRPDLENQTIAANAAAGETRIQLTSVHVRAEWLHIRNGDSGGFVTRCFIVVSGANGWLDLVDPLPAAITTGDDVRVYGADELNMPWRVATAEECAAGYVEYLGLYLAHSGGIQHIDWGVHINEIQTGHIITEIAISTDPLPPALEVIPNRQTAPTLADMHGPGDFGSWARPLTRAQKVPGNGYIANTGTNIGFWMRRTVPPNTPPLTDYAIELIVTDEASLYSSEWFGSRIEGYTPDVRLTQAPSIYVSGGARFTTTVKAAENGAPVEGVSVAMRKNSGPGTFYPPADPAETDAKGQVVGHYTAPTDPGDIGETIEIEAEV
jgi:hypothetical protein